ncbi:annexin A13-like isoform X2 [Oscarella lobularis]|uniref:annexin A13-like isoform X2 n=1 Tax=Oscarella lobularis TaxID=121494 RepID=UPI003314244C
MSGGDSIVCEDFGEFKEALMALRAVDDKIIYELNTSVPTTSFSDQISAFDQCKKLHEKLFSAYSTREKAIKRCIQQTVDDLGLLRSKREKEPDNTVLSQEMSEKQTNLRLMKAELTVEDIVQERSMKVFRERCENCSLTKRPETVSRKSMAINSLQHTNIRGSLLSIRADMADAASSCSTRGTIVPSASFCGQTEAEKLSEALKGSDTSALFDILTRCTNGQRQEIRSKYKEAYGKDPIDDLKSQLKGDVERLALALFDRPDVFDAKELRVAMKGLGTDESVLIEILCTRSSDEIAQIKRAYKEEFNRDLVQDVIDDTSGHFESILLSLLKTERDTSTTVDTQLAKKEGDDLYRAGVAYWGTNESIFNKVFATRSFAQLKATFQAYDDLTGHDIMTAIGREMSGDYKQSLETLAHSVVDMPGYFAKQLYRSMKGLGTNDCQLIRVLVTRSEIDLADVKDAFLREYKKSLADWIKGDTGGDYQKLCLAIIGERE